MQASKGALGAADGGFAVFSDPYAQVVALCGITVSPGTNGESDTKIHQIAFVTMRPVRFNRDCFERERVGDAAVSCFGFRYAGGIGDRKPGGER